MAKGESGGLSMKAPESAAKTIFKVGLTVIVAAFAGGWLFRRVGYSAQVRGFMRGGVAIAAGLFLRKKSKTVALGLGVYGMATIAEGVSTGMETDRYMRQLDANARSPLAPQGQPATQGQPTQQPAQQPAQLPGATATGYGGSAREYQAAGYTMV